MILIINTKIITETVPLYTADQDKDYIDRTSSETGSFAFLAKESISHEERHK
jgi:hypothetical protein